MSSELTPKLLGQQIRALRQDSNVRITLIVGSGFSASAGIPTAAEIVRELRGDDYRLFIPESVGGPPEGVSEYVHLMGKLGGPKHRAALVRKWISEAVPSEGIRPRVNWAHLLLATLIENDHINRVLTTNFDPLIVEALAMTGQPIRTYDLSSSGTYPTQVFEPGTVIYLHGQLHSALLANTDDELGKVAQNYAEVLHEAVNDSVLVVIGYSGDCDKFVDSLAEIRNLPYKIYWSQFDEGENCEAFTKIAKTHKDRACIIKGYEADEFMHQLISGLELSLPTIVREPVNFASEILDRIVGFPENPTPSGAPPRLNPLPDLKVRIRRAADEWKRAKGDSSEDENLLSAIRLAALFEKWEELQRLKSQVNPDPIKPVSRALGDGLINFAGTLGEAGELQRALESLAEADLYGFSTTDKHWRWIVEGNIYSVLANREDDLDEQSRLFGLAFEKYEEAIRIKPDYHGAFNNWGAGLSALAKFTGDLVEQSRLFGLAFEKYEEAIRIKPDFHEAFNNWGIGLSALAKFTGDLVEQSRLFGLAFAKYEAAIRIKPDSANAHFNLGCYYGLQGQIHEALKALVLWAQFDSQASQAKLDNDEDFDLIRDDPEFQAFRATLPPE